MTERASHASHFEDLGKQAHAARLGMWVFLGSEVLLFGALFALYAGSRAHHPEAFASGVDHSMRVVGSLNTFVLLTSSFTIASAVHELRDGRRRLAAGLAFATVALGCLFLALKGFEWSKHVHEGLLPGAHGHWFREHAPTLPGFATFWTLYWTMTGLHAVHVVIGGAVVLVLAWRVLRGRLDPPYEHPLEVGALYWHLVDVVWIFLWPCFYLMGSH